MALLMSELQKCLVSKQMFAHLRLRHTIVYTTCIGTVIWKQDILTYWKHFSELFQYLRNKTPQPKIWKLFSHQKLGFWLFKRVTLKLNFLKLVSAITWSSKNEKKYTVVPLRLFSNKCSAINVQWQAEY